MLATQQMKRLENNNFLLTTTILANIGVFYCWQKAKKDLQLRNYLLDNFTVSTAGIFNYKRYHTLLTACFSHEDTYHLLYNMFAFCSFGSTVLSLIGASRFVALYVFGGVVSSLCQAYWPYVIPKSWPAWRHFNGSTVHYGLGASGAINAVVMYSVARIPSQTLYLYGLLPVPGSLCGLAFVGIDAYNLYDGSGKVGNAAHLAGAAVGLLYGFFHLKIRFTR